MKAFLAVALVAVMAGCGGRPVEVQTGPQPASDAAVHVTNNLTQAINVYVVSGGNDIFVGQAAANSTQHLTVTGVASGSTVSLKATTADGTKTYTKENVNLSSMTPYTVP
jgi:hypothetical protein